MTDWPDRLPTTKDGETIFILRSELQEARQEIERLRGALRKAMHELGVPNHAYPATVANAWDILLAALEPTNDND